MPSLTDLQLAALRHHRAADTLGTLDVVSALALAQVLAEQMAAEGYRQHDDYSSGTVSTFRVLGSSAPERASHRAVFLPAVRTHAVAALEVLASGSDRAATRARSTLQVLTRRDRGAVSWLRATASRTRESLPAITDDELAAHDRAKAEARRDARARPDAKPRDLEIEQAVRMHHRAADKAEVEADTRDVLAKWLPTLPPGAHLIGDVWDAFDRARRGSAQKLRETKPGASRVGRTTFYALLPDLTNGGAHRRFLIIPDPATTAQEAIVLPEILAEATAYRQAADEGERLFRVRELLAAGQPAAALTLQREAIAATPPEGVVDLDAHRTRRHA